MTEAELHLDNNNNNNNCPSCAATTTTTTTTTRRMMKKQNQNRVRCRKDGSRTKSLMFLLLILSTTTTYHTSLALKKEGGGGSSSNNNKNQNNAFHRPKSQVVLRVENYLYETKNNKRALSLLQNGSYDQELKMVLSQELHEEPVMAAFGDDDGSGDDNHNHNNATLAAASSNASPFTTATATTTITTTTISYNNNPLKRCYNRIWNQLDELDKMIVSSTLPLAALTCIIPLVSTNDLFWVNQLGNAVAVAAQSASNTVYQMSFGLFTFLPSVTATLVSQHYANGDVQGTQEVIGQAVLLAGITTAIVSSLLCFNPGRYLGIVLKDGNPALELSQSFLRIRCLSLLPQVISFVAFSAFRGTMDLKSCVKISVLSNALNMALTPVLIHVFRFGINGSALTALICDCVTAVSYIQLMIDRRLLVLPEKLLTTSLPTWEKMAPLIKGSALQARSFAMHITNLMVLRKVQSLDSDGVAPAAFALAMQTFFLGSVVIYAMGMATQTLYPTAVANSPDEHRVEFRRVLVRRLLNRGFGLGVLVSVVQCVLAPGILQSTPLESVRQAAIFPILVVIGFQGLNGLACVGEGIIIGSGKFALASAILVVASMGYIGLVRMSPPTMGINGVFLCMAAYNLLRLFGVFAVLPNVLSNDDPIYATTSATTATTNTTPTTTKPSKG